MTMSLDMETTGFSNSYDRLDTSLHYMANVPDPRYVGLNRAQRRKAMAVEMRAFRKAQKARRG